MFFLPLPVKTVVREAKIVRHPFNNRPLVTRPAKLITTKRPSIFDDPVLPPANFLTQTPLPSPTALVVTELPNRSRLHPNHHQESPRPKSIIPSSFYLHREQQKQPLPSQPVHHSIQDHPVLVSQHPTFHPNIHHTTAHPTLHPESQSTSYQSYIRLHSTTTTPVPITITTTTPVVLVHSQKTSPTLHPHRFPRTHHPVSSQQPALSSQQQNHPHHKPQRVLHRFQAANLQKNPTSAELRLMPTPHPEHVILDNPGPFRFTEEDYPALDYPEFTEPPRPGLLPFIPAVPPEGALGPPPPPPPRRPSIPSRPLTRPPKISDFEAALAGPGFSRPRPNEPPPPTPGPGSPRPIQASTPQPSPENVPDVAFPGLLNSNALGPAESTTQPPPPPSQKPTFGPTIVPIVHASYYPTRRPPSPVPKKPNPYPIPVHPNIHPSPSPANTTPYPGYKPRPYPSTYHPAQHHSGGQSHVHLKYPNPNTIPHPYKSIFSTPIPKPHHTHHHSPVPSHNNNPHFHNGHPVSHFSTLVPSHSSSVTTAQPALPSEFQVEHADLDHNNNIDDFKHIRPTVNKSYIHTTPGSAGIESFAKHNAWKHKDIKPNTNTWFWLRI